VTPSVREGRFSRRGVLRDEGLDHCQELQLFFSRQRGDRGHLLFQLRLRDAFRTPFGPGRNLRGFLHTVNIFPAGAPTWTW
jgi:hypothetical protein